MTKTEKVKDHEEKAKKHEQDKQDSFDRCDTDGFVSQFASGINGQLERTRAEIERNDGLAEFDILVDAEGNKVNARIINGKYGPCWAFIGDNGRFKGFCGLGEKALAKHGYSDSTEIAPAYACLWSPPGATGFSGLSSVRVVIFRKGVDEDDQVRVGKI